MNKFVTYGGRLADTKTLSEITVHTYLAVTTDSLALSEHWVNHSYIVSKCPINYTNISFRKTTWNIRLEVFTVIPVGARFSAPVQTGPGAYPASCTMGTRSFPGVKRPGRGADHPPPSKRRGHERVGLYLYSPSRPHWPVLGRTFTLTLPTSTLFYSFVFHFQLSPTSVGTTAIISELTHTLLKLTAIK